MTSDPAPDLDIVLGEPASTLDLLEDAPPPSPTLAIGEIDPISRIYIDAETLAGIWAHATSCADREVGGFLLGRACRHEGDPFIQIEAAFPAEGAIESHSRLTFTQLSWERAHGTIERHFAGGHTIGWYHTHPGFGIFLSHYDRFIHEHFFSSPYQVALVVDPLSGGHGFFCWRQGAIACAPGHWAYGRLERMDPRITAAATRGEWIDLESLAEVPNDEEGMEAAAERFEEFVQRSVASAPHLLGRILADLQMHIAAAAERESRALPRLVRARAIIVDALHSPRV